MYALKVCLTWRFREKSSHRKGKEKKSVARGNSKSSEGEGLGRS